MRSLFAFGSILLLTAGPGLTQQARDWTLWKGNPALTMSCRKLHPDDASAVITKALWEKLRESKGGTSAPNG